MIGSTNPSNGLEIAIIGMAGRLPGARDLDQFWGNLCAGLESISSFTDEELLAAGVDPELLRHPSYVRAQGMLAEVDRFDAAFFGFSPREAEILDPQHRLFLECAWEALEDAGYRPEAPGFPVGVYAGSGMSQYFLSNLYRNPAFLRSVSSFLVGIGNDKDHLATRVSYKLNLGGPAVAVQTACSTSLVAVHLACQGLLSGECDVALAGGVTIGIPQQRGYLYEEGSILSPDGHCRAFDAAAQGCVAGSGVGIVVLKRLESALMDGDGIRAVLKGTAINNDGSAKVGYTAPGLSGQAKAIRRAQMIAEVDPATITYVEAHGTGTALGDPIEIAALTRAFRAGTDRKGFCAVGAVKTNIGHLDTASGVAGLIKTVLALEHKQLPPSLHFERPNPRIDFAASPFYVNASLADWPGPSPRRAGVSSFGIGGTNAHAIVEEGPAPEPTESARSWQLFVLSARTQLALERAAGELAAFVANRPYLHPADVAFTLQAGRKAFDHRRAVVASDLDDLAQVLSGGAPSRVLSADREPVAGQVAFLFPGQGAQHPGMGAALYRSEPLFRAELDRCAEHLVPALGLDLRQVLWAQETGVAAGELRRTALAQVAVFTVELALARLWMSWGVLPQAMLGHSVGEYVAACLSGVLSVDDALSLLAARGRLMQELPAGGMLAVPLPEAKVVSLLGPALSLAAVNGPELCVVSGPPDAVEALRGRLLEGGLEGRPLHTSHAFHSAMMDPVLEAFRREVESVTLSAPTIPYLSSLTGTWITAAEAIDADYWVRHLRSTVRFADGLETLLKEPALVLLEVGPGRGLGTLARRHPARAPHQVVVSSLAQPQDATPDDAALLAAAGRLWLAGVPLDWPQLHAPERRRRVRLPTYPFERQRFWVDPGDEAPYLPALADRQQRRPEVADWFSVPLWEQALPPAASDQPLFAQPWLIFADGCGLGARLAGRLREMGADAVEVVAGESFGGSADGTYRIDPRRREDYARLLADLAARGRRPIRILHAWSVTGEASAGEEAARRCLDLGFYSLLFLAQGLGELLLEEGAARRPVAIDVLSDHVHRVTGDEAVWPEKATLLGPCRVMPKEYPGVTCRSLDLIVPAAGIELLVEPLLAEVRSGDVTPVVAWRGGRRWVQVYRPVRLEASGVPPRLRERGVYLITGGLGGVGLALADFLASSVQAKLVLLGRSHLPVRADWERWIAVHGESHEVSRQLRRLETLEAQGAEVLLLSADVADREQMEHALAQARDRFGTIHGVIHAAGRPAQGVMQLKTREAAAAVLAPKVGGTRSLTAALGEAPLDFLVLCSSLGSLLGEPGRADYTAANAFLDAYAEGAAQRSPFTLAIGWDGWGEVGMGARQASQTEADRESLLDAMTTAEGIEAFRRALSSPFPHVLVSVRDFAARLAENRMVTADLAMATIEEGRAPRSLYPRPQLAVAYASPESSGERVLTGIWQDVLGIEGIGIDDNFFELGGDSLVGLQIVGRASQTGLRLSAAQIFEQPTVRGLAAVSGASPAANAQRATAGPVPLTPVQEWFFEQDLPAPQHWNQSQLLAVRERLDPSRLAAGVGELVRRHDALRLRFARTAEGWRQSAAEPGPSPFVQVDLSALPDPASALAAAAAELQTSLDLAAGPLLRVALLSLEADAGDRLLFVMHHLAVDVLSWQILLDDLQAIYRSIAGGPLLAEPTATPFTVWAARLQDHAASGAWDGEIAYWTADRRTREVARWPVDHPAGVNSVGSARTLSVVLGREETQALLRQVPAVLRAHPNDVLLAALTRAFARVTGSPRLRVELEGHGREGLFADVDPSRTVGWFTAAYPVVLDLTDADGSEEAVARVREELRGVPGRGLGFGLLRYLSTDPGVRSRLQALPSAEIQFAYLGEVDQGLVQGGAFALAAEPTGAVADPHGRRTHLFQVTAAVAAGRLVMTWIYSAHLHRDATVQGLANAVAGEVRTVLAACAAAESRPAAAPEAGSDGLDLPLLPAGFAASGAVEDVYPLSPLQEGLLFHTLAAPGSGVYVTQTLWTLRGAFDAVALRWAWQAVLNRHAALRTCFVWEGAARALQAVLRGVEIPWLELDWSALSPAAAAVRQEELLVEDRLLGFDPTRAPLLRLTLIRLAGGAHRLLWTFHHLLLDGWSTRIVLREVFTSFAAASRGTVPQVPPAPPYREYIAWVERQDPLQEESYWRGYLAGFTAPTSLRLDRLRGMPPAQPDRHRKWQLRLSDEAAERLQTLARTRQLTLNTISHGAWALLLAWHSGQRDIVYGTVLAGRPPEVAGSADMVGLFINTLPLRVRIPLDVALLGWLQDLQIAVARLHEHEHCPIVRVQGWSEIPRGTPLFEHALVFDSANLGEAPGERERLGIEIEESGGADQNSLALTLAVRPGFLLDFEYDPRRFGDEAVRRLGEGYAALLDLFATRPEAGLAELWERLEALDAERTAARAPERSESAFRKFKNIRAAALPPLDPHRIEVEAALPPEE